MDLRRYNLSPALAEEAGRVLSYQPFIVSDDVQTGVAYSWLYDVDGGRRIYRQSEFVFDRRSCPKEVWQRAEDANSRLRRMYDDWLDVIAARLPGASVAEVGCNTGYLLAGAQLRGMGKCTGVDLGNYQRSVAFLNKVLGTRVHFKHRGYNSWTHQVRGLRPHDVVIASAVMQHLSDPLYLLAFLGRTAKRALFLFTGMSDTDALQIHYAEPNRFDKSAPFPVCFDNDVGLSRGLLMRSLALLGFHEIVEIPWSPEWLPREWYASQKALLCMRTTSAASDF
jgi:SAM-dependent methyltransferase